MTPPHIPHPRPAPPDHQADLIRNLRLVESGVKTHAPGVRRCHDCHDPYIDDHSGLPYCRRCRTDHHRTCAQCVTRFRNTTAGDRLCASCTQQTTLFGDE